MEKAWKLTFEGVLNPITLFIFNILVIIFAETVGHFFLPPSLMHFVAIGFIALSFIRVFVRPYSYDPILENFFNISLLTLVAYTLSHALEYSSMGMSTTMGLASGMSTAMSGAGAVSPPDASWINTANFDLINLLLMVIGADVFLRIKERRSRVQIKFLIGLIVSISVLIIIFILRPDFVSLDLSNFTPYIYTALLFLFGSMALRKIRRIGKSVSISSGFTQVFSASIVLIIFSALTYVFHKFLESRFNFPMYQIMDVSHFLFYASLSLFFLAFGRVKTRGGIYEDLKKTPRAHKKKA